MNKQVVLGTTKIPKLLCDFTWTIEDFSLSPCGPAEAIESARFTLDGMQGEWYLELWPNGTHISETDNFGMYLILNSQETDVTYNIEFSLKVISICDPSRNIVVNFKRTFQSELDCGRKDIVARSELLKNSDIYLPSDTLTLMCSIMVTEKKPQSYITSKIMYPHDNRKLLLKSFSCNRLKQLFLNGEDSDFTLKVEGHNIPVHKLVLSISSPVLKSMLKQDMLENKTNCLEIKDLSFAVVKKVVEFIYTGETDIADIKSVMKIYKAAHKYNIEKLQEVCIEYFCRNMEVGNVCEILKLAELYKSDVLLEEATKFVAHNSVEVRKSDEWKALCDELPKLAIELYENMAEYKYFRK